MNGAGGAPAMAGLRRNDGTGATRRLQGGMVNIVLVGFMGTGKSSVGKLLARTLNRPFVDMDDLIEERAGKTIPRIFKEDGEPAFRAMERDAARELAARRGIVVAAGGGAVLNPDNMSDFNRTGLVVCLSASKAELLRRLSASDNRPLLENGGLEARISGLLDARQALYDAVPRQVDTTGLTAIEVAARVLDFFNELDRGSGLR